MKKLLFLLCALLFFTALTIEADNLGVKKSSETIVLFLNEALDSAGAPQKPDSAHILTYADNASAANYTARSTTYPFADISIDTLKRYGDTSYVFVDAIGDIDGAGGNFELAIDVTLFTDGLPTSTHATVQVIADSLNTYLVGITTVAGDVANIDGWNPITDNDSLVVDLSTLATSGAILDDILDTVRLVEADVDDVLDTLKNQDNWVATAAILDDVVDTLRLIEGDVDDILDTLKNQDNWVAKDAILDDVIDTLRLVEGDVDDILDTLKAYDDAGHLQKDVQACLDTLQNQDNWIAKDAILDDVIDTLRLVEGDVDDILDTLKAYDDAGHLQKDVQACLDTLQNQDNWVAKDAILDDVIDTLRLVEADVDDVLDTLKNQDNWVAKGTILDDVIDTLRLVEADVDDILDTLKSQDDWVSKFNITVDSVLIDYGAIADSVDNHVIVSVIQDTLTTGDSVAVMPDYWSAADTVAYQGAAAGLTKADIADTVNVILGAQIDTLSILLGGQVGCYSYTHLNTGADSVWLASGADTLAVLIFFHPGGAAGDPPDSFKVVAP